MARPEITNQKDPKSITQNLFDTAAAERFYTTLIPVRELFPRPEPKDRTTREDRSPTKEGPVILHGREEEQSGQYKDINQRPIRSLSQAQRPHAPTTGQHNGTYEVPEVDEDREAVPEAAKVPQTLTHFSIQNLKALVKLVQGCERILSRVQPSEHPPYPEASNITRMHVTLLAFADQSMFYVFNTPQALSASFRKDASEDSSSTSPVSIDFGRMVQAFHWLQKFDVRSQLIIASLPVAIKSLHITSSAQRRREGQESSKNLGGDKSQSQIRKTSEGLGKDAFRVHDEREAAHVALQVFAVLVATVPPCNLQEWHIVYTCHQGGRMVPPEAVTDPATIRSVQQVLDAFEDEMALNLLSRLCEALATRLWISDLESVVGKEQRKKGLEVSDARRSVVDCVLDTLFESKQSPVPYRTRDGLPGWRYDAAQPDEESLEAPRYIGIIAEWLRYLVSKQWDGSAEVDRFSAVGGALEILWCFGRYYHVYLTMASD